MLPSVEQHVSAYPRTMTPDSPAVGGAGGDPAEGSVARERTAGDPDHTRGHRFLAHTADTAFEAWGPTRADCYAEAVRALVASFADISCAPLVNRQPVDLGPAADDHLLVDLLDEVIYLLDARGLVVAGTELHDEEDGGLHGHLELAGVESVRASGAVPKAVTYHGLETVAGDAGWRCRVTVDV